MRGVRPLAILAAILCLAAGRRSRRTPAGRPAGSAGAGDIPRDTLLVCQGQSIDDSDSELARDLRRIVRDQVAAGRSDGAIRDSSSPLRRIRTLPPRLTLTNGILWGGPFLAAAIGAVLLVRRRRTGGEPEALSAEEEVRIAALGGGDAP